MIWTILKADLLWVLMMLPVQIAITVGPTLWRRRRGAPAVDRGGGVDYARARR